MSSKKLHFQHDGHVTKRTFRFAELDEKGKTLPKVDAVVGSLYVKKNVFGDTAPEHLTLNIEW